ncbi:MAG TPA: DUF6600 domain-containing protein [Acidobacteriaceae bacterium]
MRNWTEDQAGHPEVRIMERPIKSNTSCRLVGINFRRGLVAWSTAFTICLGLAGLQSLAQNQDQGPPQYPQQDDQQGPPQYPQPGQPQQPPQQNAQQYPQGGNQQGPMQSAASVARVSFAQGGVQINTGGQAQFEQALMNMPLLEGSVIQTQEDGQVEIEFNDGSVARLTPNSSVQVLHMAQDGIQLQQLSGLAYYELNVGQGQPPYNIAFANASLAPLTNSIFRVTLDNMPEVAVINGTVEVTGDNVPPSNVTQNQTLRLDGNAGAPYTIAQNLDPDSWDQWNQDRDQAISQEAAQQTAVRDQSGASSDENWNDLDYYGNWYPVPSGGNVWVPSGVDASWDPYGYGYWGYYPTLGYTWISGYPWGWLPYHCGSWNYYSFGWGWSPGRSAGWAPVGVIHGYPGYFIPARPIFRYRHDGPVISQRLIRVERGPNARGPWIVGHPFGNHPDTLHMGGRVIAPVAKIGYREQGFATFRGTTPGVRTALGGEAGFHGERNQPGPVVHPQQPIYNHPAQPNYNNVQRVPDNRPTIQQNRIPTNVPQQNQVQPRLNQVQPRSNTFEPGHDSPSTFGPRNVPAPHYSAPPTRYTPPPAPHYSAPPAPHYSAPPVQHYSAPPAPHYSAPPSAPPAGGGGHGRH